MPSYLAPGVYVEEIERGPRPIEGVPTSIAAFLGETERGPLEPRLVTSFREFKRWFGDANKDGQYIPVAVSGFFGNGGQVLYVCRVVGSNAVVSTATMGDFTLTAAGLGDWGNRVWYRILPSSTKDAHGPIGFRLRLAYWDEASKVNATTGAFDPFDPANRNKPRPQLVEDFDDLSVDPKSSNYYRNRLIDSETGVSVSGLIDLEPTKPVPGVPTSNVATGEFLAGGKDDIAPLTDADYIGAVQGNRTEESGLTALHGDPYREVALVYAPFPPANDVAIANAIIADCEQNRFRFAVVDSGRETDPTKFEPRSAYTDTEYAATYTPWVTISDPRTGAQESIPPGGHVLGVYARTDTERGVWKAPANEIPRGVLDVYRNIDQATQEVMNPNGLNAIRKFPGRGIRIWGARTMSSNGLWKYVSVRRLFIFLEHSIYEGTQWVVFEPNDERLWARVKDSIRLFLRTQWREGALFGSTEDEAFFITCDRSTMTQDDILNGRLICEIGIAPVRPAEFVIFRIFQQTAEAQQ